MLEGYFPKDLEENFSERFLGIYHAKVTDHGDPLSLDRVRVRAVGVHTEDLTELPDNLCPWAEVSAPYKMSISPTKDDWVYIMFINGDPMRPLVIGECKIKVAGAVGAGVGGPGSPGQAYTQNSGSGGQIGSEVEAQAKLQDVNISSTTLAPAELQKLSSGDPYLIRNGDRLRGCTPEMLKWVVVLNNYMKSKGYGGIFITDGRRPPTPSGGAATGPHYSGMAVDFNPISKGGDIIATKSVQNAESSQCMAYREAGTFWKKATGGRWLGNVSIGGDMKTGYSKGTIKSNPVLSDIVHIELKGTNKSGGSHLVGAVEPPISEPRDYDYYQETKLAEAIKQQTGRLPTKDQLLRKYAQFSQDWNITYEETLKKPIAKYPVYGIQENIPQAGSMGTFLHSPKNSLALGTGYNSDNEKLYNFHLSNISFPAGESTVCSVKKNKDVGQNPIGRINTSVDRVYLSAFGGNKRESKFSIDMNYPESWIIQTNGANGIVANDRKNSEAIALTHKSKSFIQIDPTGNIAINSRNDGINISSKRGLLLAAEDNIDISTHKDLGMLSEGSMALISGIGKDHKPGDGLCMIGSNNNIHIICETVNKKRVGIIMDTKKAELLMAVYPEQGANDLKVHKGILNPHGYIKISQGSLVIAHETKVEIKSPALRIPTFSRPSPWNPTPDTQSFQNDLNKAETILTAKAIQERGFI